MEKNIAIEFNNVGKQYRLGLVGTGSLQHDLNRWWQTTILGKEDPYLKIGEVNDRSKKGNSDYVWALKDISFKVEQGDVVGIIGKNGAGKSTLLKLLSHITAPTTGDIRYRGRIASLLEVGTGFHPEMTARQNIYMNGSIMGMTRHEITSKLDEIVDFAGIERYLDTPVKRFSSGMTVRLGFAVAAFLEPEILVVDEVLAVGDAEFQKKAIGKMKDVSSLGGRTVLFVSHNMDAMLNLCNNGILLENGITKYSGDIKSTVANYLDDGHSSHRFEQPVSDSDVFISKAHFVGETAEQMNGLFAFDENVTLGIELKRKPTAVFDPKTVISIYIQTFNKTIVCCNEIPLSKLSDNDTLEINLSYPSSTLLAGNYSIRADIHIPNVCFFDRQDLVSFTVYDSGTELLKYQHVNFGFVKLNTAITINNEKL